MRIINTDRKTGQKLEEYMLRTKSAAVSGGDPWFKTFGKIEAGEEVGLYANGVGLIARGIATGLTRVINGFAGERVIMVHKLRNFRLLSEPRVLPWVCPQAVWTLPKTTKTSQRG
jgi:hypothetical protein